MSFTLTQYRTKLRLDLKDSGSLWSDGELDRAVQRAYDDLSRFLPKENSYDHRIEWDVSAESFTTGEDTDADQVVAAADISAVVAGSTLTIAAQPDKPRVLTLTITDANSSITDFVITVAGSDRDDLAIEEAFVLSTGLTQTGKKEFKSVTSVTITSITGNGAGDVLNLGVGSINNVWHYLANSPIEDSTITITSSPAGTTYTEDIDYEVDYSRGAVRLLSGGSMAASTTYLATYEKTNIGFNLRSLLPDYNNVIRVTRVLFPADLIPQQFVSFHIWNDILYVTQKRQAQSQETLTEGDHIAFWYEEKHRPPTTRFPGSAADVYDEVICIGAQAYALFIKAYSQEHQAITDLASARTALGNMATATGKVATYLDNNTNNDAASILEAITSDAANLRTAIETAVDAMATALGLVTTDLTNADGVWTSEAGLITTATGYLTTGAAKIDLVNIGDQVAALYAQYCQAQLIAQKAWAQKRQDFLTEASSRIQQAVGYGREAELRENNLQTYINQAEAWVAVANSFKSEAESYLTEAVQYQQSAQTCINLAARFNAEATDKRSEFWSILKDKAELRKRVSSVAVNQNL